MKNVFVFLIFVVALVGIIGLTYLNIQAQEKLAVIQQQTAPVKTTIAPDGSDPVLNPDNWHRAIFNGVEHTIYTGPGVICGWKPAPQPPKKVEKKAEEKPADPPKEPAKK